MLPVKHIACSVILRGEVECIHKPWKMINLQGVRGAEVASLTAHPNSLILSKFLSYFPIIHIIRIFKER